MDLPPAPAVTVPDWRVTEAALAAGSPDPDGTLALAAAHGCLAELTDPDLDPDDLDRGLDRAEALLDRTSLPTDLPAVAAGLRSVAAEGREHLARLAAYRAEHGTTPRGRLQADLDRAHRLYHAGDRPAARALFRQVAAIGPWTAEFAGHADRIDLAWCRLLEDAARTGGPDAARAVHAEVRAQYHAATFPHPMHAWPLIEVLLGAGVPDLVATILTDWLTAAGRAGRARDPLTAEQERIYRLALAELTPAG